ncbi:hypothetical protein AAFC00_004511 [Neodothiora populina]|uniref:Photolyase/cryptochrome alpha/beta domain-containing protein n=1 Tax=Neodothiora populina TaxID=2781224 RepID=A0ABR3P288_9PEZI
MPPKKAKVQPKSTKQSEPSGKDNNEGPRRVIHWYRTDLRLHDSPSLAHALSLNPTALYCVWTWDPHYVYRARVGANRWQFLTDSQRNLSESLTSLNPTQKLLVVREAPQTVFPKLLKQWGITDVVFEKDTDAYARARDDAVVEICRQMDVRVTVVKGGRTLWDPDEIVKCNGGKPTMTITQLQAAGAKIGEVDRPLPAPTSLPDVGDTSLEGVEQSVPDQKPDFNEGGRQEGEKENSYGGGIAGPNGDFGVPTMEELGLGEATTPHRGGETLALEVLEKVIADEDFTGTFEKPKTAPTAFEPQSTCLTSPHLHFGTLSVHEFWWRVEAVLDKRRKEKKPVSEPPTSLHGQLLFRDMYFAAQAAQGYYFAQQASNSICRFIPWHLPSTHDISSSPIPNLITGSYTIDSPVAEQWFQRWKHGQTGFPWIDGLMRQLRTEGWIHHLGRHAVACFLTRGGCYIHWERGAEVFEELLLDHETACNSGNWMWLACVAFYSQFYRCYSPVAFGKKWDPEGAFIRKYVPELAALDKKYIYEPWKAPIADQRAAGVVVKGEGDVSGKGDSVQRDDNGSMVYPKPMFDFSERREICISGLKEAYAVGLHGDDSRVLDGSWKALFKDEGEGPTRGQKGGIGGDAGEEDVDKSAGIKQEQMTPRGKKRERGQGTLDSAFKKTRK